MFIGIAHIPGLGFSGGLVAPSGFAFWQGEADEIVTGDDDAYLLGEN